MRPARLLLVTLIVFLLMGPVESIAARYVSPDLQNRLSILIVTGLAFTLVPVALFARTHRLLAAAKSGWPMLAFVGLALASAAWSLLPGKSVLYAAQAGLGICAVIGLVSLASWRELLCGIALAAFLITLLSIATIPAGGLMDEIHIGAFRGIFPEKNRAAQVFGLGAIAAMTSAALSRNPAWLVPGLVMAGSVCFTQSTTSFVALCLGLAILVATELARHRSAFLVIALWAGCTLFAAALIYGLTEPDLFYVAVGDNPTLTGRSDIWPAVMQRIQESPLLGYGYGAFWDEDNVARKWLWLEINFEAYNAHNSWLEVWLAIGIGGVVLQAWFMLRAIFVGIAALFAPDDARRTLLAFMLPILAISLSESVIGGPEGPTWLVFLVMGTVACMRPQPLASQEKGRAHEVRRPDVVRV